VFDDLNAAKFWAWKHQEHRRNLTAFHRSELALKLKDVIASKAKERQQAAGGDKKSEQAKSVPQMFAEPVGHKETRRELAEIADVSHTTLNKVEYAPRPSFVAPPATPQAQQRPNHPGANPWAKPS